MTNLAMSEGMKIFVKALDDVAEERRIEVKQDLSSVSDADLYAEYITRKINNTPLDLSDRPF